MIDLAVYVGDELFFRSVSRQVSSPQQSLTSVFGMGTGGPSAIKTLTKWCTVRRGFARQNPTSKSLAIYY